MRIFGIETSCDETAAALVSDGRKTLASTVYSQVEIHRVYAGVVPELASRAHTEHINRVVAAALRTMHSDPSRLHEQADAIAYTRGPGLAGALLVGQITAQTLAYLHNLPLIAVNHIEGHLYAALLAYPRLKPPYLSLVVSGGHTELIVVNDYGRYTVLGGTRDDAAGEAFDKVAKLLGLPYPGGPAIDVRAATGNAERIVFPRPLLPGTWDFSFSGLKTAVVNYVKKHGDTALPVDDICASFQEAVVDTLRTKAFYCARAHGLRTLVLGGGVASNSRLRAAFLKQGAADKVRVYIPPPALCADNAAMIACAGYYRARYAEPAAAHLPQRIEPALKLVDW
jgi:N6-L-threonylcarbamoyladenine synthase